MTIRLQTTSLSSDKDGARFLASMLPEVTSYAVELAAEAFSR
jgi:hypothetical protein